MSTLLSVSFNTIFIQVEIEFVVSNLAVVVVVGLGTQTQSGPAQIKARDESLSFYQHGLLRCPN